MSRLSCANQVMCRLLLLFVFFFSSFDVVVQGHNLPRCDNYRAEQWQYQCQTVSYVRQAPMPSQRPIWWVLIVPTQHSGIEAGGCLLHLSVGPLELGNMGVAGAESRAIRFSLCSLLHYQFCPDNPSTSHFHPGARDRRGPQRPRRGKEMTDMKMSCVSLSLSLALLLSLSFYHLLRSSLSLSFFLYLSPSISFSLG